MSVQQIPLAFKIKKETAGELLNSLEQALSTLSGLTGEHLSVGEDEVAVIVTSDQVEYLRNVLAGTLGAAKNTEEGG